MEQVIQVGGSLFVLVAFVLSQRGLLAPSSRPYLVLNAIGSAVLAVDAARGRQWGFLLLEGVWALVSLLSLVRGPRAGAPRDPAHRPASLDEDPR